MPSREAFDDGGMPISAEALLTFPVRATEEATGRNPPAQPTNAITRSWHHLDVNRWAFLIMAGSGIRCMCLHPFAVAFARKAVSEHSESTVKILVGLRRLPGGLRNWYRGLAASLTYCVVGEVSNLLVIEYTRALVRDGFGPPALQAKDESVLQKPIEAERSYGRDAVAGFVGDAIMIGLVTPFAVICNRQMSAGVGACKDVAYLSTAQTVRTLWATGGVSAMYRGFGAAVLMLPGGAVWWASYGEFKYWYYAALKWCGNALGCNSQHAQLSYTTRALLSSDDNVFVNSAAGVSASGIWALAMNPLLVIKTRVQAGSGATARMVTAQIFRENGWRGFYKGTVVSMGYAVVDGILFSMLYELTRVTSDKTTAAAHR